MKSRLTWFVIIAMITGPLFGLLLHEVLGSGPAAESAATVFSLITTSFLRLIKMIIAPLVFSTLVVGVARMEGAAAASGAGVGVGAPLQFKDFLDHIIPSSVVQAMANNEILQIVVFSLFFGAAASSLGSKVKQLIDIIDEIA